LSYALGGVIVSFGSSFAAPILYASSTQINLAVPLVTYDQSSAIMQVSVNGVNAAPRQFSLTYRNPSLFLNIPETVSSSNMQGPIALALNADGSTNSPTNPATLGSVISVFVNGLTEDPQVNYGPLQLTTSPGWQVTNTVQASPFVIQVDVQLPSSAAAVQAVNGELVLYYGEQAIQAAVYVSQSQ
jgi:uncharacterized protein (TIGR03437 family)